MQRPKDKVGLYGVNYFQLQWQFFLNASAPECAYRLCHLPLKMSWRKVVFVSSYKPNERFRLLQFGSDETTIYNNIFDRYTLRPDELEDLSLAEFAVGFENVSNLAWSEEDGDGELRQDDIIQPKFIRLRDNTRMRIKKKKTCGFVNTILYDEQGQRVFLL